MQRIKKGDEVVVISGSDKGKRGTVLRIEIPIAVTKTYAVER